MRSIRPPSPGESDRVFDDGFLADCPARLAVELIADKWSVVVIYALDRGARRHGELIDLMGGISKKMLTQTLRRLEGYGLVSRQPYVEVPPRVEYELTELGRTLIEPIELLTRWAEHNGAAVLDAQEEAARRSSVASSPRSPVAWDQSGRHRLTQTLPASTSRA